MSNVTDILDRFATLVEGQIANIYKLPNPYDPESAPATYLSYAYGLGYGPAINTRREIGGCNVSIQREVLFMQIQEVASVSTNESGIKAQLDEMLENELLVIKAVIDDLTLNGGSPTVDAKAMRAVFTDADGPEFLVGEKKRFFRTVTAFEVEYFETIP